MSFKKLHLNISVRCTYTNKANEIDSIHVLPVLARMKSIFRDNFCYICPNYKYYSSNQRFHLHYTHGTKNIQ